jgi:hypothetical protein
MIKSPDELLRDELICFHTKMKLKESTLGIGVTINRLPRTGEIRMVTPTLDLISMRAFIKQKVRHSLSNEKFTHWLPLFFGEKDEFEEKRKVYDAKEKKWEQKPVTINLHDRFMKLLLKSMCFIYTGSTRKQFKPQMIMEMMPKLIITHVADLIQEVRHVSILAIRRLINFIRLFHLLIDKYPEIGEEIDRKIEQFIKEPEKRHKDHTSSLGDLLSFVSISQKYTIQDIMPLYLEEQMDRQAFWILKEIPELDHTDEKYKDKDVVVEEARTEICFKTGMSGFHITLFFFYLNKMIIEASDNGKKNMGKFCTKLDSNFGCIDAKSENMFQKKCF